MEHRMLHGTVAGPSAFNADCTEDERRKPVLMRDDPGTERPLHLLVDLKVIRGSLLAFDLDAEIVVRFRYDC
jgi:hypothetical protein